MTITLRALQATDIAAVVQLQTRYTQVYPGVPVIPGEVYLSPGFHAGEDVFCAFDETGKLLAYAPVYAQILEDAPPEVPHSVWTEIKADPDLPDPGPVKDALLGCVMQHATALTAPFSGRPVRIVFEYQAVEDPAIAYVQSRGFTYNESVFSMARDLRDTLPEAHARAGIHLRRWKMESEAEQKQYAAARNECFPESPIQLGEWKYFMLSPQWAAGVTVAAFDGSELAGSVTVYWDDGEIERLGSRVGYTEYVFVRPAWRGRGLAPVMLADALRFLKEHHLEEARLAVRARNENALGLYLGLGYRVTHTSQFFEKYL